jgi:hypothetical protein
MQNNKISNWWLVAVLLPLTACVVMQMRVPSPAGWTVPPVTVERFSAELARVVSYGLVGDDLLRRSDVAPTRVHRHFEAPRRPARIRNHA